MAIRIHPGGSIKIVKTKIDGLVQGSFIEFDKMQVIQLGEVQVSPIRQVPINFDARSQVVLSFAGAALTTLGFAALHQGRNFLFNNTRPPRALNPRPIGN